MRFFPISSSQMNRPRDFGVGSGEFCVCKFYRGPGKGLHVLLSNRQAGQGRNFLQILANSCKFLAISCNFLQFLANSCNFLQFLQILANFLQFLATATFPETVCWVITKPAVVSPSTITDDLFPFSCESDSECGRRYDEEQNRKNDARKKLSNERRRQATSVGRTNRAFRSSVSSFTPELAQRISTDGSDTETLLRRFG